MPRIEGTHQGTDSRGRKVWRPVAIVNLVIPGVGRASGPAVIDSGADVTIFPFEIAAGLKVEWDKLPLMGLGRGAGGTFERRLLTAQVFYRQWKFCDELEVAEPGKLGMALLGRHDFFRAFVVRFAWHKEPPEVFVDPIVETAKKKR